MPIFQTAYLHGSLAASCSLLEQVQNVEAALLGLPHGCPRDADRQCQEALGHMQKGLPKLVYLFFALEVRPGKN